MNFRRTLRKLVRGLRTSAPLPLILMYHRIDRVSIDPWGLAVSPERFKEHLDILRRTRQPFRLADFVSCLQSGTLPMNAVSITFDDGYVDNLVIAKPLLVMADVPATLFLATGYVGDPNPFWWDELARLILAETGPQRLTVDLSGSKLSCELGAEPSQGDIKNWRAWSPCSTARQSAYLAIWRALRSVSHDERVALMNVIRCSFAQSLFTSGQGRPMTPQEVRELANDGLITIGAHTVTHPSLIEIEQASLRVELSKSKIVSEELCNASVSGFAYPYGEFDARVLTAVKAAGFAYACSTNQIPVTAISELFFLPRIQMFDWGGDEFEKTLRSISADHHRRSHPGNASRRHLASG